MLENDEYMHKIILIDKKTNTYHVKKYLIEQYVWIFIYNI